MAISIHNVNEVNQLLGKRVNSRREQDSAAYKQNSHENGSHESEAENKEHRSKFSQGLKIFMDTAIPGKKMLSELTGIAEMDAVGLQFFIAMQRQFVRLRLSKMNEHDGS